MIKCTLQYFLEIKSTEIKCWFWRRGENRSTGRKTSRSRVENQQTQPTYDAEPRPHWWDANALTLRQPCSPIEYWYEYNSTWYSVSYSNIVGKSKEQLTVPLQTVGRQLADSFHTVCWENPRQLGISLFPDRPRFC